jgi:conjugal transfer pilus assembly protein TraB
VLFRLLAKLTFISLFSNNLRTQRKIASLPPPVARLLAMAAKQSKLIISIYGNPMKEENQQDETQQEESPQDEALYEEQQEQEETPSEELSEPKKSFDIKSSQQRNLIIIALVVITVFYFLYSLIAGDAAKEKALHDKEAQKQEKIEFASPIEAADTKSIWIDRIQNQLQKTEKDNQQLSTQVSEIQKKFSEQEENRQNEFQQLKEQMSSLGQQMHESGRNEPSPISNDNSGGISPQTDAGNPQMPAEAEPQIRVDKLGFSGGSASGGNSSNDAQKEVKTATNYVPSGTFVKAVMLGGADVAAGAMSQSDPSPMLFRILENGTLPNHRHSSLKNCLVTAAVVGDISSETGKIRLERMSCTRPDGKVIDLAVEGTVFGPSGKNGIRGTPVWREGSLLQRAFVAGALSGLSSGLSQKYTTTSLSPLGGSTQTINNDSIFKYGAAQGIGKAMDRLAEYNIRRAEQYHPVIQLSAGAIVDVVFLKGFFLSETPELDLVGNPVNNTREPIQTQERQPMPQNPAAAPDEASYQAAQTSLQRMKSDA